MFAAAAAALHQRGTDACRIGMNLSRTGYGHALICRLSSSVQAIWVPQAHLVCQAVESGPVKIHATHHVTIVMQQPAAKKISQTGKSIAWLAR